MGARTSSPLTTLEEVLVAVRRLLDGEEVTVSGKEVTLDAVALERPPTVRPLLLAGVRGPRSLALAGRVADGVLLAEPAGPHYVRAALDQAGRLDGFQVAVYAPVCVTPDRATAHRTMAPWLAGLLADPSPGLTTLPFFDDLVALAANRGVDGVAGMPADWWTQIGPIGNHDDAVRHVGELVAAGVSSIGFSPAPEVATARSQVDDVVRIIADLRAAPA
jgi:5,10-methylenetetrahydromethanopterin reductase